MTNSMGLKKKLLIGVLTAALCASTCAGGLLIEANAEGADAADLVTATGGATVTAAKSYTTSAGDFTTPAGLYISAPDDKSLSYGAELNGIFTGSTGIKAYFPGEGFWGAAAQTTITVTSVADSGGKFRVHIGGEWQRYGYVTYDWNGETLYRTVNSYADNSTYYYREDNVKDVGSAQYLPIQGWMESDGGRQEPYIGFEMQTDGTFNVVLVSGHNAGVHKTIASFCEEKSTFEPTTEASGTEPNLPKLDLSKGYTISIGNSDSDNTKSFDLLIESIATSATGDPYAGVTVTPQTTTSSTTGEGQTNTSSDEGLLFSSASAYSFDLVGRFEGDTTITWSTAAENDWDVQNRQVEFIVADATNPENYFKVVWRSPYQSAAYVEYVYHGTTLYCAQYQYDGKFYYTYADVTNNNNSQYLPTIGQASSSGILGLRWSGDVLNVVVLSGKVENTELILASFENDPEGFEPATTGTGEKSNLPKISFENGYTISVNVTTHSGAAARSATAVRSMKAARTAASESRFLDFLLQKVETEVDTISFDEDITAEPAWSTEGQKMPTIEPLAKLPGMQSGEDTKITVPELTYTQGTADAELFITWIHNGKTTPATAGQELDLSEKGDHILRCTVTADGIGYTREITIHVCDYKTYVSGTPATCVATGLGTYECEHQKTMDKILPIDPSAHDYRANWTWNGATPSVEFECRDCDKTTQSTGEITVTEIGGVDSTCLTQGKKTLQASVIFGGSRRPSRNGASYGAGPCEGAYLHGERQLSLIFMDTFCQALLHH